MWTRTGVSVVHRLGIPRMTRSSLHSTLLVTSFKSPSLFSSKMHNLYNAVKGFSTSTRLLADDTSNSDKVTVHFKKKNGKVLSGSGKEGENLLDVVVNCELDIDGYGACEGTLACSTCHLIFQQDDYERLGSMPSDEEMDMLDLAYGLTDTSRLGCQVKLKKELDGMEVEVPEGVNDQRSS